MKKISFALFISIFLLSLISTKEANAFDWSKWSSDFEVSARAGAFLPCTKRVKRIYSRAWGDYQLEIEKPLCQDFSVWLGAQYTENHGHSLGDFHRKTKIQLVPISFGLKYSFCFGPCTNIYVGAGPTYSFLRIKDDYRFVHEHVRKESWGGLFKIGVKHYFTECFFVELFTDYLVQNFSFKKSHSRDFYVQRHDANLDALIAGGGIGIRF